MDNKETRDKVIRYGPLWIPTILRPKMSIIPGPKGCQRRVGRTIIIGEEKICELDW